MRYFFIKHCKILLRKKFHCKSKICARVKIHFAGLISMFSFIIQSLMNIYFCPKRFGIFFENHRTLPPKVVLVVLQFIHDLNTTGRPIGVDNVHNSQCLGPVFMHLNIAVIHLIVFTVGTGVHHVCQTKGVLTAT